MEPEIIQGLLDQATDVEKIKLSTLNNGYVENLKKFRASYSPANLKAFKACEKALQSFAQELQLKYEDANVILNNVRAVRDFLRGQDKWKFADATIYNHHNAGKFKAQEDGNFSVDEILAYAEKHLPTIAEATTNTQSSDDRKKHADAELKEYKLKILKGDYILVSEYVTKLSEAVKACKSDFENFHHAMAAAQVAKCEGNENYIPDLLEFNMRHLDKMWLRWKANVDLEKDKYGK